MWAQQPAVWQGMQEGRSGKIAIEREECKEGENE